MDKAIEQLEMKPDLAHRFLNDGFSGGEKKRNEIVQMMMLKPAIAMLDEIDSGLDVDALRIVSDAINQKWIYGWIKKGFKNVKNPDLWKRMVPLIKAHQTTFHWVKGHAGHLENEICDELAVKAAQTEPLLIDEFFEHQQNGGLF